MSQARELTTSAKRKQELSEECLRDARTDSAEKAWSLIARHVECPEREIDEGEQRRKILAETLFLGRVMPSVEQRARQKKTQPAE